MGLHHHAAVVAHHLACGHNVHRPDPRPQAAHLLRPALRSRIDCAARQTWGCSIATPQLIKTRAEELIVQIPISQAIGDTNTDTEFWW